MKCPVACDRCGEILELDDCNFYVKEWCGDYCQSMGCQHGICDDCLDEIAEEGDG